MAQRQGGKSVLSELKQRYAFSMLEKEEDRRVARVLLIIILVYWAGSLIVLFMDLTWGDGSLTLFLILGSILQVIPLYFLFKGWLSAGSFATIGIYIAFTTLFATTGQGLQDYVIMAYPAIIVFAGLTERRRGLFVSTLLILAALTWLVFGETNDWFIVRKPFNPSIFDLILACLQIIVVAVAVYLLVSNLEYELAQTGRELAERRRMEESLHKNQQNLLALIENSDGSIWSVDSQYNLIIGNALYHRNVSAAIGRRLLEGESVLVSGIPQDIANEWRGYYDRALQGEKFSIHTQTRFTSSPLEIEYHFNPIQDVDGVITGVTVFGRDITERKHIENALIQSEQRFKSYVQSAPNIITIIDYKNQIRYLNRTELNLPDTKLIGNNILDLAPVEYREATKNALDKTRETAQPCSYVTSAKAGDTEVWYENYAVMVEPQNRLSDIIVMSANITARRRTENAFHESEARLRAISDNLTDAAFFVYVHDKNGRAYYEYVSSSMERLVGVNSYDALTDATKLYDVILPEYRAQLIGAEIKSRENFTKIELEICLRHAHTGKIRWCMLRSTPYRRSDGSTFWYGVQIDITEQKQSKQLLEEANQQLSIRVAQIEHLQVELREQAIRDSLTGLYNRRYMEDVFEREFARATRESHPLSVIMLDMDELKVVNDSHGHHVGDRALQALASCMRSTIRAEDIACRYGGDEFSIIMNGTSAEDAVRRVEEWREILTNHPVEINAESNALIRFSAGVASFPAHGISMQEVLSHADIALYRAKARGRNRTIKFE
jgi:diguanylate cyclase (GGDEF)-like protein/PAS domain S-box-containing protein